jgi:hypothetical protein
MPKMSAEQEDALEAMKAVRTMMAAHPEFTPCPENRKQIDFYLRAHRLQPTEYALERAYYDLANDGKLVLSGPTPKQREAQNAAIAVMGPKEWEAHCRANGTWPKDPRASTKAARVRDYKAEKKAREIAMMTASEAEEHFRSIGEWPER